MRSCVQARVAGAAALTLLVGLMAVVAPVAALGADEMRLVADKRVKVHAFRHGRVLACRMHIEPYEDQSPMVQVGTWLDNDAKKKRRLVVRHWGGKKYGWSKIHRTGWVAPGHEEHVSTWVRYPKKQLKRMRFKTKILTPGRDSAWKFTQADEVPRC